MATNAARPAAPSTAQFLQARRRVSVAMRPPAPSTAQVLQPRRRVSIATAAPHTTSEITTPLRSSAFRVTRGNSRQSMAGSQRKGRYSSLFAPLPVRASVETTPMSVRTNSSKFMMGSPTQADSRVGSSRLLALQRKPVVWSPLQMRGLKNNNRKSSSLLPYRPTPMQ